MRLYENLIQKLKDTHPTQVMMALKENRKKEDLELFKYLIKNPPDWNSWTIEEVETFIRFIGEHTQFSYELDNLRLFPNIQKIVKEFGVSDEIDKNIFDENATNLYYFTMKECNSSHSDNFYSMMAEFGKIQSLDHDGSTNGDWEIFLFQFGLSYTNRNYSKYWRLIISNMDLSLKNELLSDIRKVFKNHIRVYFDKFTDEIICLYENQEDIQKCIKENKFSIQYCQILPPNQNGDNDCD